MTVHRLTTVKASWNDRIIGAAEDKVSIDQALQDVEPARRDEARENLLAGKPVAIGAAVGSVHIKVRLVPIHARSRSALRALKEKV